MPETMAVVAIVEPGGPEVLQPATRPVPPPRDGEVLIRVRAAGVNRPVISQRTGKNPPPPGHSDLPGLQVAGAVPSVGHGVTQGKRGAPDSDPPHRHTNSKHN